MTKEELIKLFEDETGYYVVFNDECLYPNTGEYFADWLIERLANKDAEIERMKKDLSATNRLNIEQAGMLVDRDVRAERLQSAHDKQAKTIQKQSDKIATLVKQVEANGECHKGLTAKPCHCEVIKSAHDNLKQRISGAPNIMMLFDSQRPFAFVDNASTAEKLVYKHARVALVELTPEEMEKNDE